LRTRNPQDGCEILGAHVEGPFLNPGKGGIHDSSVFRTLSSNGFSDVEACYGAENLIASSPSIPPAIRIMTGAPELSGMMSVIAECKRRDIVFSIGHSAAGIETAEQAVQSGATMITHLFNAMQQLHHRDPGIVGLLGSADSLPRPYYGIICDGIHIHKSCVKLAYRSHPQGAILVTDAMAQLGLPNGTYEWTNGKRITKDGMHLHLEGEKTIAGRYLPYYNTC
jgi:N-acetylglucosamine-6-phosphate deacetylase